MKHFFSLFGIIAVMLLAGSVSNGFAADVAPVHEGAGLVPCGTADAPGAAEDCNFQYIITLVHNLMNFLLFTIAVPLAAISFAWAGWLYMSAVGDEGKVKQAHDIFKYVVIGLCIALAAWLVVNALVVGLGVKKAYNFLGTT